MKMTPEQVLNGIHKLASSQGHYGRLYRSITSCPHEMADFVAFVEKNNFTDIVDFILATEC